MTVTSPVLKLSSQVALKAISTFRPLVATNNNYFRAVLKDNNACSVSALATMPRLTCAASEVSIFQRIKKLLLGGAVFVVLNMAYHSFQLSVTKTYRHDSSLSSFKRDGHLARNTTPQHPHQIWQNGGTIYFNGTQEHLKDNSLPRNRPAASINQFHSKILRTRTNVNLLVGRGQKSEVIIEPPLLSPQVSNGANPRVRAAHQSVALSSGRGGGQILRDTRAQDRSQLLHLTSNRPPFAVMPPVVNKPPMERAPNKEEPLVIERQLTGERRPPITHRQASFERPSVRDRTLVVGRRQRRPPPTAGAPVSGQLAAFKPRVVGRDLRILENIVDAFTAAMKRAGVAFFLYSGSLLGSWRHHGLVPWDDDVDFAVPRMHTQRVYRALSDLKPRFQLDVRQKVRWKFYSDLSHPIRQVTWSWPFVDISFYEENGTHVWDQDAVFPAFCFPKSDVFPLQGRPFMGRTLPAPKNTEAVLRRTYNLSLCKVGSYNHHTEAFNDVQDLRSVSCAWLSNVFPFVHRAGRLGRAGCNETLVRNGSVVSWFFVPRVTC